MQKNHTHFKEQGRFFGLFRSILPYTRLEKFFWQNKKKIPNRIYDPLFLFKKLKNLLIFEMCKCHFGHN